MISFVLSILLFFVFAVLTILLINETIKDTEMDVVLRFVTVFLICAVAILSFLFVVTVFF